MRMTAKQLAQELSELKDELQDKPVYIRNKEGELIPFDVRFILVNPMKIWDKSSRNVEAIILE